MQAVVVTGVSSGIGLGAAKVLLDKGFRVFGSVRNGADGERLAAQLGPSFTPLVFDVTDERAVQHGAETVRAALGNHTLRGLVNNAGIAIGGPLLYQPLAEFRAQVEVNLLGPFIVTQAFAPLLGADRSLAGGPGRIVNISSVGGVFAGPFLGGYHATKFGLEGYSESLRRELQLFGIDVIVVGPGAVATPIWDKAEQHRSAAYRGTPYESAGRRFEAYIIQDGRKGYTPAYVGEVIWQALTSPRPRVRYSVVSNRLMSWLRSRLLPKRLVDRMIARSLGFTRG
jgi:NAD(P)-dependent dehydrogenase (short-subunit alcohol dehydrogenase family)